MSPYVVAPLLPTAVQSSRIAITPSMLISWGLVSFKLFKPSPSAVPYVAALMNNLSTRSFMPLSWWGRLLTIIEKEGFSCSFDFLSSH